MVKTVIAKSRVTRASSIPIRGTARVTSLIGRTGDPRAGKRIQDLRIGRRRILVLRRGELSLAEEEWECLRRYHLDMLSKKRDFGPEY